MAKRLSIRRQNELARMDKDLPLIKIRIGEHKFDKNVELMDNKQETCHVNNFNMAIAKNTNDQAAAAEVFDSEQETRRREDSDIAVFDEMDNDDMRKINSKCWCDQIVKHMYSYSNRFHRDSDANARQSYARVTGYV